MRPRAFVTILAATVILNPVLSPSSSFCQEYFYYCGGKKMALTPNYNSYSIQFDSTMAEEQIDSFLQNAGLILIKQKDIGKGFRSIQIAASSISLIDELKKSERVTYLRNAFLRNGGDLYLINEIVVQFHEFVSEPEIQSIISNYRLEIIEKDCVFRNCYLLRTPLDKISNELDIANELHESPIVEFAEPNFARRFILHTNDTYYNNQYQLSIINAPNAWNITHGSSQIVIAILDEGVDLNQEDLNGKLVTGYDMTNQGDGSPQPLWNDAHGTACAGIAAAETDNGQGMAGLAWNCKIMPIQVSYFGGAYTDWCAKGISAAWRNGAHVLSNSWGMDDEDDWINKSIDSAATYGRLNKGSIVIFSAGNNGGALSYPSYRPKVIAVGATDQQDARINYSNYGDSLDLMAPSGPAGSDGDLWVTDIMGSWGSNTGGSTFNGDIAGHYYKKFNGTSASAALVAGLAAMILSIDTTLIRERVEGVLKATTKDLGTAGWDQYTGFGRIDAYHALRGAKCIFVPIQVPTIEGALSIAASGDCVVVRPGTHYPAANLTVNSGVKLGVDSGATIKMDDDRFIYVYGNITARYANFVYDGPAASGEWEGIYLQSGSSASKFHHCLIKSAYKGIYDLNSQANSVGYCDFDSCGYGIYANGSGTPYYHNTRFRWCTQDAIRLEGPEARMHNIRIQNNFNDGFWFTTASCPWVHESLVENNSGYGVYCYNSANANFDSTAETFGTTIRENGNTEVYVYNATPKFGDTNTNPYTNVINAITDDAGNLISLYYAGTVKAEKVWWGENPPPTARMTADGSSTLDYSPYGEYNPNWSYKAAGGEKDQPETGDSPYVRGMREIERGNTGVGIGLLKTQIDSLPGSHEAKLALVKLKNLDAYGKYAEHGGNLLEYLNEVTNTHPELLVSSALVSEKILEGMGFYGDAIDIFEYLLAKEESAPGVVLSQCFSFYLIRMGDIKKAEEVLSMMKNSDVPEEVIKDAESLLEKEKTIAQPYSGELKRSGIYRIGSAIVEKSTPVSSLPTEFNLHAAFPNPFNPSTTIRFDVPQAGNVRITIFNVLGQRVAELVNENIPAGSHQRLWDASRLGSGIYLVRMEAKDFSRTMKVTFLK